jgi:hypothetical protein
MPLCTIASGFFFIRNSAAHCILYAHLISLLSHLAATPSLFPLTPLIRE